MSGPTPMDYDIADDTFIALLIEKHLKRNPTKRILTLEQVTRKHATIETERQREARSVQVWSKRIDHLYGLFTRLNNWIDFMEIDTDFMEIENLAVLSTETTSIPFTHFINTGEFATRFQTLCHDTEVPPLVIETFTHHGVRCFLTSLEQQVQEVVENFEEKVSHEFIFPIEVAEHLLSLAALLLSYDFKTLQNYRISPLVRFVANIVVRMRDADDLKHGPENEMILFAFAKLMAPHNTCPLFANLQNEISVITLPEILEDPSLDETLLNNLVGSLLIRLHQAIGRNDNAHRSWTMKIYFLLYAMKLSEEFQSGLFSSLFKGYAWLTVAPSH
jgi:hypothetical protein